MSSDPPFVPMEKSFPQAGPEVRRDRASSELPLPAFAVASAIPEQLGKRLRRALLDLVGALTPPQQLEALSARDDLSALISALLTRDLRLPEFDEALLKAQLRGVAARRELATAHGGSVVVEVLSGMLGKSRQAIEKQRAAGALIAVQLQGERGWHYPLWQFDGERLLRGLGAVLKVLPRDDPWAVLGFFLRTDTGGGETPLVALKAGKHEVVLRAARAYGEQGAS